MKVSISWNSWKLIAIVTALGFASVMDIHYILRPNYTNMYVDSCTVTTKYRHNEYLVSWENEQAKIHEKYSESASLHICSNLQKDPNGGLIGVCNCIKYSRMKLEFITYSNTIHIFYVYLVIGYVCLVIGYVCLVFAYICLVFAYI